MRLIDADELSRRMYTEAFVKDTDMQKWDSGCWIRYKLFENVLEEQPTIEPGYEEIDFVQPHKSISVNLQPQRKTGKWILHKDGSGTCSECGITQKAIWDMDNWQNYCGHCGADMRGEQE